MKLPHYLNKKSRAEQGFLRLSWFFSSIMMFFIIIFVTLWFKTNSHIKFETVNKIIPEIDNQMIIDSSMSPPLSKTAQKQINNQDLYFPDELDQIPNQASIAHQRDFNPNSNVEYVHDEAMEIIEDPEEYISHPPERPLVPRNFYQEIKGVDKLEISPGVIVLHNYSAIKTTRVATFAGHKVNITTFDSGFMKEHFIWLPPFKWVIPKGLTKVQYDLFWKQPENHWHFDDCKMWNINVVWEIENGVSKICNQRHCSNRNYTHHLNFCEWPRQTSSPKIKGNAFAMGHHYINIFQHFFDNGIPHISTFSLVANDYIDNRTLTIVSSACNSVSLQVLSRLGFPNRIDCTSEENEVSAENLFIIPTMRVLHPYYYDWFREKMNTNMPNEKDGNTTAPKKTKIVILPRGVAGGGGGAARVIYNIMEVRDRLAKIHGEENVIIPSHGQNLDGLVNLFSQTKTILGPHGGAFYNHFFADKGIDVIEMIPMLSSGKYPLQNHWNKLIPFAHLAFLSNVQLMSQNFWRYISMDAEINYNVDIEDFLKWAEQVPSLQKN